MEVRRVLIVIINISVACGLDNFIIPPVRIQAFQPKGVRVSIPDDPGKITYFNFNGNVNKRISDLKEIGEIRGEVKQSKNGRWTIEDPNKVLKLGDVIYYYIIVETGLVTGSILFDAHFKGNQRHVVQNFEDRSSISNTDGDGCKLSLTVTHGNTKPICSGQTLLQDRFYKEINDEVWQVEQYIPIDNPEYPFISYQRSAVSIVDRRLHIEAKLQQEQPGFSPTSLYDGVLNLSDGCTSPLCSKQGSGPDILPPVVTGRLTSKGFAFKYGTVNVRAKLPKGDWIYPEIMLEPHLKKYGNLNYASGLLRIATARGNDFLLADSKDYGNKVLYAGPIMDFDCREKFLFENVLTANGTLWSDDFHTYTVRWTPEIIALSVDGKEWGYVEAGGKRLSSRFPDNCTNIQRDKLIEKMAPFDDFFHITLGLSVGGVTEFRDDLKSREDKPKPWRNSARKGMIHFWQDLAAWHATWTRPKLIIESVEVVAL